MTEQTTPDFSELDCFVEVWGIAHWSDRAAKRAATPIDALREFHAAMAPRLEEIICFLNQWPVDQIPDEFKPLSYAALAMCEVDASVEVWNESLLQTASDPRDFVAKSSYYDSASASR